MKLRCKLNYSVYGNENIAHHFRVSAVTWDWWPVLRVGVSPSSAVFTVCLIIRDKSVQSVVSGTTASLRSPSCPLGICGRSAPTIGAPCPLKVLASTPEWGSSLLPPVLLLERGETGGDIPAMVVVIFIGLLLSLNVSVIS